MSISARVASAPAPASSAGWPGSSSRATRLVVPWSEVKDVTQVVKLRSPHAELGLGLGNGRARRWLARLPGA
ncbi:MAG: hypothetical protein M3304_03760 [Actinomycetota bacterium]|nr:hypothetical protein [Actinomycetota bacterium]